MLHKRYFVALLCGALCLVGCLKNEESPSVTEVRNAKANELNASAALLNAQAQATTLQAQAEASLKQAQADLEKAKAKKEMAEAQLIEVEAELKAVEVELAKVKVEEEKVELQKKKAELEMLQAQLEVAKKEAEVAIQALLNQLEELKAQAQINAINAQRQLIEAQQALEELMLTYEADEAEAMQGYIQTYFGICQALVELQKQAIDMDVNITNYINGVNAQIDVIAEEYDALTMQYTEVEALLEYIQQYQTMSPEEKNAKIAESYEAVNEALTAWAEATKAYNEAQSAYWDYRENNASMYSDFNIDDEPYHISANDVLLSSGWGVAFADFFEGFLEEGLVAEEMDVEGYDVPVEVKGVWMMPAEEGAEPEFLPLWQGEQWVNKPYYFLIDTEAGTYNPSYGQVLFMSDLIPAVVYTENMNTILDKGIEIANELAATFKEQVAVDADLEVEALEEQIADLDEVLVKEEEYLSTRKPVVEAAEQAFVDAMAAYNEAREGYFEARDAYSEYMIMTYDIKRNYFQAVYEAKADKEKKDAVVTKAKAELDAATELVPTEEEIYQADLAAAEKEAAYNAAVKTYNAGGTAAALAEAAAKYDGTGAGSDEIAAAAAQQTFDDAKAAYEAANLAYVADPEDADKKKAWEDAKTAMETAQSDLSTANKNLAASKKAYEDAAAADLKAQEPVTAAEETMNEAKEAAQELKDYTVDPLLEEAFIMADADTAVANANLQFAEEQLAAAFEELDQEGVKYEEDEQFVALYEAYLASDDELDDLGIWYDYWDPETGEYVYGGEAGEAYNALRKLYYTVYRNKDGYSNPYRYMRCAYDLDSKAMYVAGWYWDDEEQAYVVDWEPMGGYVWVETEEGMEIEVDEEGNPVIDETGSRSYQKAQYQAAIDAMPEYVAEQGEEIDAAVEMIVEMFDGIREDIAVYDTWKPGYDSYVAEVQALSDAWNEADQAEVVAHYEFILAKAAYKALAEDLTEYFYIYEEEEYEEYLGPEYYAHDVDEWIEMCQEVLVEIETEIDELLDSYDALVDDTYNQLDKMNMDYDLLLKKIAVFEELAARYEALIEELFGIDLSPAVE